MRLGHHSSPPQVLQAREEHRAAHGSQHHDVGNHDQGIGVAEVSQHLDELDAQAGANQASPQKREAHLEIHVAQTEVSGHAGGRSRDDLARVGSGGNGRGNADHHEDRCQQESASTPSKPDRKPTRPPPRIRIQMLMLIPATGRKTDIPKLLPDAGSSGSKILFLASNDL